MQLLELLVNGGVSTSTSEQDVIVECGSFMGYLECIKDMTENDVLTETTVMESVDIKAIAKKVIGFFKDVFRRIGKMLSKLASFLNGQEGKFKEKQDDKPNDSNKEDSRTSTPEDIFNENPYTGTSPIAVANAVRSNAHMFCNAGYNIINKSQATLGYLHNLINHDYKNDTWIKQQYIDRVRGYTKNDDFDSTADLLELLDMNEKDTGGVVNVPKDLIKFPGVVYARYRTGDTSDRKGYIFTKDEFASLITQYNSAVAEYHKQSKDTTKKLVEFRDGINRCLKDCDLILNQLGKIDAVDFNVITRALDVSQKRLTIGMQCLDYFSVGIVTLYSHIENDLSVTSIYIDKVQYALKSVA